VISAPGPIEVLFILGLALLLLGPNKLPDAARSIGRGVRELREALQGRDDDEDEGYYEPDEPDEPDELEETDDSDEDVDEEEDLHVEPDEENALHREPDEEEDGLPHEPVKDPQPEELPERG
jgi:sec-independent protein translocase protein TatA